MALCARLLDQQDDRDRYSGLATSLRAKLEPFFWDDTRKAMVHNRIDGIQSKSVTRYSNMFSVIFGYSDAGKQEDIKQNVLLNDSILKITTPYMRFYELEALCALGEQELVMQEIKDYWG